VLLVAEAAPGEGPALDSTQKPLPPLSYDPAAVKPAELIDRARAEAAAWHADAFFAMVVVDAGPDGTADIVRNPSALIYYFQSPSTNQSLTIMPQASRTLKLLSSPGPIGNNIGTIDGTIRDLPEILATARRDGLAATQVQATLSARPTRAARFGGKDRASWLIVGLNPPAFFLYDAATGARTTEEELSGVNILRQVGQQLATGRKYPADMPRDFEHIRQEADRFAADWDRDMRLYRVDCLGTYTGGRIVYPHAEFFYWRPRGNGVEHFLVRADREAVHGQVYSGDSSNFHPQPIPEKILSDQEAITRLWALNPNIGDRACLQLLCVGAEPPYTATPETMRWAAEPMGVVMTATDPPAFNGRLVWRLLGVRAGALSQGMMSPNRHTEFLYIDAVTGAPLSRADGPLPEPYRFGDKPGPVRTRLRPPGPPANPAGP
jgi:hypothetical protein